MEHPPPHLVLFSFFLPPTHPPLFLQCKPEEVEDWVVKAISAGLVDGKMNQDSKVATFSRSVQREFTDVQWRVLKDRMDTWVGSISSMLRALGDRGDAQAS